MILMNAGGEREQDACKMIDETQLATLWAFPGKKFV